MISAMTALSGPRARKTPSRAAAKVPARSAGFADGLHWTIDFITPGRYLLVKTRGIITPNSWLRFATAVRDAAKPLDFTCLLLDHRESTLDFSVADIYFHHEKLLSLFPLPRLVGTLVFSRKTVETAFMASRFRVLGVPMRVFYSFRSAKSWLLPKFRACKRGAESKTKNRQSKSALIGRQHLSGSTWA